MTGYTFERLVFGWLAMHVSHAEPDQRHIKVMLAAATPQTQRTLNLYVAGSFEVSVRAPGGAVSTQVMLAGQSSLDLTLALPAGAIVTERALAPGSVRYCLEPEDKSAAWSRRRFDLLDGEVMQASVGELLVPMRPEAVEFVSGPTTVFAISLLKVGTL